MNLTPEQRLAVQMVERRHARLVDVRISVEATIRAQLAERVARETAERDRAIVEAHAAGVPKAAIARAMGTTNPQLVREVIARNAAEVVELHQHRYAPTSKPDEFEVTLDESALDAACRSTGWRPADAFEAGVHRAKFRVKRAPDGLESLVAVTPSFEPTVGRLQPAVWWVRQNKAEALAWWSAQ